LSSDFPFEPPADLEIGKQCRHYDGQDARQQEKAEYAAAQTTRQDSGETF
jgi:hypothetical protein